MQFNAQQKEISIKIVYYGPPLSGKTTNLQAIHRLVGTGCGHLTVLDTADDRTLFFDLLPVVVQTQTGYRIKIKLYTVPGQVIHAATRRVVLAGADGIVFVADSQLSEAKANSEFWHGMRRHLRENALDPDQIPMVIQFNKRDLPNIRSDQDLLLMQQLSPEPIFKAAAVSGEGVLETLQGLLLRMFDDLKTRYDFERRFQINRDEFLRAILNKPVDHKIALVARGAGS